MHTWSREQEPLGGEGETSRIILEWTKEHWKGYMGAKKDNHMWKHQEMEHKGEPAKFIMRVEGSHKSVLSRQVREAVRLRRRGGEGNILNSKLKYNRSHIPRLQVEDEEKTKKREEYLRKMGEEIERNMDMEHKTWEQDRVKEKNRERQKLVEELGSSVHPTKEGRRKRNDEFGSQDIRLRSKRRRKHSLIGVDWGASAQLEIIEEEHVTIKAPNERKDQNRVLTQQDITLFLNKKQGQDVPSAEVLNNKEELPKTPKTPKEPSNPSIPNPDNFQEGASPAQVYPSVGSLGEECLGGGTGGRGASKRPLHAN